VIFDLKSGKRRRVVQVVFGFLAFVFFISFVGFGVGSDVTGGIFDALGIGGSNSSGSDPQFEQQIEDAQDAVAANPKSGNAAADLIGAFYASATSGGVNTDQQTGQVSISEDAHNDLLQAAQAWDDYLKTKPAQPSLAAAASAVQVFQLLNEAGGAAEAQEVVANDQKSAAGYAQLAFYLYADLQIDKADAVAKKAVAAAAAEGSDRKQIEKSLQAYHDQAVKFQKQQEQQQRQAQQQGGGATGGGAQLEDPFGGLGGTTGGATTVPPTSP
jgi:hypothetical protein